MVELAFVQQVTALSSLLLAFSFPAVAQLATVDRHTDTAKGSDGVNKEDISSKGINSSSRWVSGALAAFIVCASAMLVATFIGLALTLILSHYQAQPTPQKVLDASNALVNMWSWPFLIGIVSFLLAFVLLGCIRSQVIGIIATIVAVGAGAIMFIVWGMLSGL